MVRLDCFLGAGCRLGTAAGPVFEGRLVLSHHFSTLCPARLCSILVKGHGQQMHRSIYAIVEQDFGIPHSARTTSSSLDTLTLFVFTDKPSEEMLMPFACRRERA